jgi:hypothetical protein
MSSTRVARNISAMVFFGVLLMVSSARPSDNSFNCLPTQESCEQGTWRYEFYCWWGGEPPFGHPFSCEEMVFQASSYCNFGVGDVSGFDCTDLGTWPPGYPYSEGSFTCQYWGEPCQM